GFEKIKDQTWEPPENFIERKCIDYWKSRNLPEVQSLVQPAKESRQTVKKRKATVDQQESNSEQCNGDPTGLNIISNEDQSKDQKHKRGRHRKNLATAAVNDKKEQMTRTQNELERLKIQLENNAAPIADTEQIEPRLELYGKNAE
ncbi:hypothetical protein BGZ74_003640, partial [Mortierella antarctica]